MDMYARPSRAPIKTPEGHPTNPYLFPVSHGKIMGFQLRLTDRQLVAAPRPITLQLIQDAEEKFRRFVFNELDRRHYTTTSASAWLDGMIHESYDDPAFNAQVHRWQFPRLPMEGEDIYWIGSDWAYHVDTYYSHYREPYNPNHFALDDITTTYEPNYQPRIWFDLSTGHYCGFYDHPLPWSPLYESPAFYFPHPTL